MNKPIPSTTHYPLPTRKHPTPNTQHSPLILPAFTLVELLVVLFLMGILYAIVFNAFIHDATQGEEAGRPTLAKVDRLFRNSGLYRQADLVLYGTEEKKAYLVARGKVVETYEFPRRATAYVLNPDETLQSLTYPHMKFGTLEITPVFRIRCREDGLFDPQILMVGERWLYIHPYETPRFFENASEMVAHIRQSDYLPDKAGYAQ